jgi:hypothetical protein
LHTCFALRPSLTEPVALLISRRVIESGTVGVIAPRLCLFIVNRRTFGSNAASSVWPMMTQVITDLGAHSASVPAAQQDTNLDLVAYDKQMASQMPQLRTAMIRGLTALNRS